MANALQDRPVRAPRPPSRRSGALGLGAAALVAVLAWAGADRVLDAVTGWDGPLQEQTVVRDRPALELALSDLSEYSAARGTYSVVVDLEKDTPYVPAIVKGERTTYLAHGSVDGVVDFRGLDDDAVQVEGGAVTITLPAPRLGEAELDLERSRVVARDRGLVDRISGALQDSPTSEREVALLAEDRLEQAAAESDLRDRAQESTRSMLTGLARSFGFTSVTVRFDGAAGL